MAEELDYLNRIKTVNFTRQSFFGLFSSSNTSNIIIYFSYLNRKTLTEVNNKVDELMREVCSENADIVCYKSDIPKIGSLLKYLRAFRIIDSTAPVIMGYSKNNMILNPDTLIYGTNLDEITNFFNNYKKYLEPEPEPEPETEPEPEPETEPEPEPES